MIDTTAIKNETIVSRRRGWMFSGLTLVALVLFANAVNSNAQRVYGVASRTTVATNGHTTVVHRSTVVATGGAHVAALPHGYIAVLPGGYRAIGGGIYMAGSVRYRATFYQGRTVYIRL